MHKDKPVHNYFSKPRVETFSDGIFAIIVTLLVLEIHVPSVIDKNSTAQLTTALILLLPKFLSWAVSFLMVCVIWVNHHRIFEQLKIITHGLFWLNANLLLWCSFIPFPTALMGDYINNPVALMLFGFIMATMSLSFSLIRYNILRHKFVADEGIDWKRYRIITNRSIIFGPLFYSIGGLTSFLHPYISFIIYFLIPFYFIFYNYTLNQHKK